MSLNQFVTSNGPLSKICDQKHREREAETLTEKEAWRRMFEEASKLPMPKPKFEIEPSNGKGITLDAIMRATCLHFGINMAPLVGESRRNDVVLARHIAMWIAKEHTGLSYVKIARRFGDRDHTSAIFAVKKIDKLKNSEPYCDHIELICEALGITEEA